MNRKIITAASAVGLMLGLAACDNFQTPQDPAIETAPEMVEPAAPAAEDAGADAAATAAPPVDSTALPPEERTSEQSVQPESETLFY